MPNKATTLYAPDGRTYSTSNAAEITSLKARGYSETKPKGAAKKPEPDDKSAKSTSS